MQKKLKRLLILSSTLFSFSCQADIPHLWSKYYQGTGDLSKENRARTALQGFGYTDIPIEAQKAIETAVFVFGGDMGVSPNKLRSLLVATGQIESFYKHKKQIGGGPARSFWQVEPETALDLLNNSSALFGPKFWRNFPNTNKDLEWLSQELERNTDFGAAMAAAKWVVVLGKKL